MRCKLRRLAPRLLNQVMTMPEPKTSAARVAAYRERRKTRSIDVDGATFDRLTAYKTDRGLTISGAIADLLSLADEHGKSSAIVNGGSSKK